MGQRPRHLQWRRTSNNRKWRNGPTITRRRSRRSFARSGFPASPSTKPSGPSCGDDGAQEPRLPAVPAVRVEPGRRGEGEAGQEWPGRRDWENWVTTDDLDGLVRWQAMFGPGFRAVLAFAYAEPIQPFPLPGDNGAYEFRGLEYRFWAVGLDDYVAHLRSRGPAWKAVAMARRAFRRRVRPLLEWLPDELRLVSSTHPRQGAPTMTALFRRFRYADRSPFFWLRGSWQAPVLCPAARAQRPSPNDPTPEEATSGSGSGRPLDGYLGTLVLVGLAFFIVGKSARR